MMIIPEEVKNVISTFKKEGFQAYAVGGCVRDFLQEKEPADWDVATSAKPEEIQKIFPESFYENKFLTVTVRTGSENEKLEEIEITTFRSEAKYTDKRHPDEVKYAKTLEEDLARRDFTINAMAIDVKTQISNLKTPRTIPLRRDLRGRQNHKSKAKAGEIEIIDPFGGQKDLEEKIIRAVGNAEDRFSEDALRMMRAVRFATTLGFKIEEETAKAIQKNGRALKLISQERIRDEFVKIMMAERPDEGIELLRKFGLLKYVLPEIEEGYGIGQNKHHIYDCYQHSLLSLKYAAKKNFNKLVRIASLLHDVAKPRVKAGEGLDSTFYNHEIVGGKMTSAILSRLKFPKKEVEKISKLVRYHLFYYNVGEVTESSVRRLLRKVGPEDMEELLQVRMADRIGSGVPKAEPYKLRHLKYVIDKVSQDAISARMIKINGNEIMKILNIQPGPKVGQILDILLAEVLEEQKKNEKDYLEKRVAEFGKLSEEELKKIADKGEKEIEKIETKRDEMTKAKYWVT